MARQRIKKPQLRRTHFPGKTPMLVDGNERVALAYRLRDQLATLNHSKLESHPYYFRSEEERARYVTAFRIDLPENRPWSLSRLQFTLQLNDQGQLTITDDDKKAALVSSLEEVVAFARLYHELAAQYHAQAAQRQKVRDLKTKAILAQVKKLAREERFAFYAEAQTRKLDLQIKLAGKKYRVYPT